MNIRKQWLRIYSKVTRWWYCMDAADIMATHYNRRIDEIYADLKEARNERKRDVEQLAKLCERVMPLTLLREPTGGANRFRLMLDFNEQLVYQCFEHGNDNPMIEYLADAMRYNLIRELRTMNFRRVDDFKATQREGRSCFAHQGPHAPAKPEREE